MKSACALPIPRPTEKRQRATWSRFIYPYPVQYTGFKLFYHNDTKAGAPLLTPKELLQLRPSLSYIQYQ